jgi:hypothetical protein
VQQAVIMGLVFGTMCDLTALWMIYNGLEARIAGAVFK